MTDLGPYGYEVVDKLVKDVAELKKQRLSTQRALQWLNSQIQSREERISQLEERIRTLEQKAQ